MNENEFKYQFCGYIPRENEQPRTGSWYCPKCGKRTTIKLTVPSPRKIALLKKQQRRQTSRDQISSQLYQELTKDINPNFGLKDPYLNPNISPIKPKNRKKVRVFAKKFKK